MVCEHEYMNICPPNYRSGYGNARAEFNPGVEISTLLAEAGLKCQPWGWTQPWVENIVM
jgi:hypothetical protein